MTAMVRPGGDGTHPSLSDRADRLPGMRFGISLPIFGSLADVRLLADLAADAESAGWDAFFIWDHLRWPSADDIIDPWIAMTAIALNTERILTGPMVTPMPRRRPQKLARETVTLDRLSGGRFIFGVGAGGDHSTEYENFGEATDPRVRAAMLDESLEVITGLWSGQPFSFEGAHYTVHDSQFLPTPLQQPRIPIWVAGQWPRKKPVARAARWDGYVPIKADMTLTTPDEVAEMARQLDVANRPGFDLAIFNGPEPGSTFAGTGATWCLDGPADDGPFDVKEIRGWIKDGPRR
jgi:alkanesulfonate monooxygenase SsuD/methylene tetrahydromethanopterin reductase-like flavin-dependent oxidoreductase (luciferase family)